jgi:hypothetical protein
MEAQDTSREGASTRGGGQEKSRGADPGQGELHLVRPLGLLLESDSEISHVSGQVRRSPTPQPETCGPQP